MKELKHQKELEKEALRKEMIENGEDPPEEEEKDDELEGAPDYNEMVNEKKSKLTEQREQDTSKLEEISDVFKVLLIFYFAI